MRGLLTTRILSGALSVMAGGNDSNTGKEVSLQAEKLVAAHPQRSAEIAMA